MFADSIERVFFKDGRLKFNKSRNLVATGAFDHGILQERGLPRFQREGRIETNKRSCFENLESIEYLSW